MTIRPAERRDADAIWAIFREVVGAGETYPIAPDTSREEALRLWFDVPRAS